MKNVFDFLVADSTPSGLIAAIAAAREGLQVAVVTEDKHLGGMQTSGLGWTNAGQRATVGGLASEFFGRVREYYIREYGAASPQVRACDGGFLFESHVAEKIYLDWLQEVGVEVFAGEPLTRVENCGNRLIAVATASQRIEARIFLDSGYEGDLLHLAGCDWRVGRESTLEYGESLAGLGDRKLQPYDYRLCLTNNPRNQVPFRKPESYNPQFYEWHAARMQSTPPRSLRSLLPLNPLPNSKTDSRTAEMVGASWDWPHAGFEERQRIARIHRDYSAGYIWFLLTDPRVPRGFQDELHQWGHAADEFTDNSHWPYHIYVREARRLRGEYVMTQRDVTSERRKSDAVALGSFYLDVHSVDLVPDPASPAGLRAEGGLGSQAVRPYEIPYRALLPQRKQCENLLVSTCLSASHIAFSTIRMEPVWMLLGHAAGIAAVISAEGNAPLHEVPIADLQQMLAHQGQMFDASMFNDIWPSGYPAAAGVLD